MDWLLQLPLMESRTLLILSIVSGAVAVLLIIRPGLRRVLLSLLGAAIGAGIGALVFWWVVNVQDVFGVDLSDTARMWVIAGFAGIGLALANLFSSRLRRKVLALLAIPVLLLAPAAGINADFGAYHTLGQLFGSSQVPQLDTIRSGEHGEVVSGVPNYATSWTPPEDMPLYGEIGEVAIPTTVSGFTAARPAQVWLPPAALVDNPPVLPVIFILSGQPGSPAENFEMGRLSQVLDDYARSHRGLAPIAVAVDQLGDPGSNPLCIDSQAHGKVQSYLTQDVPAWVRANFRVSDDPSMWMLQGFSQGATCTVQFITEFPQIFGSGITTGTQLGPLLHEEADTVAEGFGGDQLAYDRAQPLAIMLAHGQYANSTLLLGVGKTDDRYRAYSDQLADAARTAGIHVQRLTADTGHDWYAAHDIFAQGLSILGDRMGLR